MNKKLIASLLTVSMAAGTAMQTPVQLMASTVPASHQSVMRGQALESQGIVASVFSQINQPQYAEYEKSFKVTGITGYENNGGQYSSSALKYAFDGNIKTHWETGKANSSQFKNEVIITFDNIEIINRIAYAPRPGNKGHVQKMSIYASLTESGNDFELVASGSTEVRSSVSQFRFPSTEFKRLKFVFDQADQDWAAAGEFMFFKEDVVADKMEELFTDSTKNQVSEAFNSLEKLEALEEEAKTHPFYEQYKEDLYNARIILENQGVNYTDASVTKFDLSGETLKAYDELYKVRRDEIKSITNNGGGYVENVIERAIDGDTNTKWHSNKQNSDDFKNEVVIELNKLTTLNRVVYTAPRGTNRGFPERFDIYGSRTSKGDTFELVSSGSAQITQDSIEIKFNPTEFKRLKFVFQKGYENWACISELGLYKEDTVSNKMRELFTNGLMMGVSPKYDSLEGINELEAEAKDHPLKENYLEDIKLAKEIIKNKDLFKDTRVVTGEQRGKYLEESSKRSINGAAYTSFESVGKYVTPGEEIVVYLDADSTGILPRLFIGQIARNKGDWKRLIDLKPGKNVIKVPNDINPAAIYLFNDAGPSDQAYAPRIRVEGGTKFPIYFHGETDPEAFFEELQEYAKNIEYRDEAFVNGNPSGKVFNIAEFVSENVVITTTAKGAIAGLTEAGKQGYNIADTMDGWEDLYDMFQYYLGFEEDAAEEKDSYFPNKFIARGFLGVPHAYASHGYTGYSGSDNLERDGYFFPLLAMPPQMKGNDDWAYAHEFGHIFNTKHIVHGEVSNNLFAQEFRRLKAIKGDRVNWNGLMKRFQGEEVSLGFWENLGVLSQLDIAYGYDAYAKASKAVRDNPEVITSIEGSGLRRIAVAYSLGVGENLLDFFEGWNYTDVTPQMEEAVKHLPKPTRKIEYLHGGAYDYTGNGFSEDVVVKVSSKLDPNTKTNLLKFEIDDKNQSDLLGYEILKEGKVIGFTKDSSFTVKNVSTAENENYQVVAYAKNLATAKPVSVYSFAPSIKVQQEKITIELGETFNAIAYIKGSTHTGEDITTQVKVAHNVDSNHKGVYEVKYTLVNQGITVEKVIQVEVVSGYDYLSDTNWTSAQTDWSAPRRNDNLTGRVNGTVKAFEKGFGIHANGRIVYDLSGKVYDRFEALVGVDMGIEAQNNSSIVFNIVGDGQVLATTKVMKHADDMAYINVPISGVSELVIEVKDSGNGISSDHGIIANPKLTTNNAAPTMTVTDKQIKLGEEIDFMEGVVATDAEDGDLTSKVQIISNIYESGKVGRFEVVYGVTDTDKNTVEKKAYLTVYEDFKVNKSKYGVFDNLAAYNKQFKLPIHAISNNGGNYGSSVIARAIDGDVATHWETGKPNSDTFKNEVIFDLGKNTDIDKMTYAARRGGKGFATGFDVYVSSETEGNDFILAGKGKYSGNGNDVIEFRITRSDVRRVKFVFDQAAEGWASIGEVAFYKADLVSDKVVYELFADADKTKVTNTYNTLEKLAVLRAEVSNHPAARLLEADLNKAEEIIRNTFPALNVEEMTYVKLNSTFDLMTGVTANDQEDGDILSKVQVKTNSFTINKTGTYHVTYTVADSDGNTNTKERTIVVYSEVNYLSDRDWESARTDYGSVRKDKASVNDTIKLGVEGVVRTFEKGIGTHANSEIVYDLSDLSGALFFETYVGVDRNIVKQDNSSIIFKILGDGEELYNSGLMKWDTNAKSIKLNLTGVTKLELIVDNAGNGNASDHGSFGDAKFLVLDAAPSLEIPKDEAVKVGEYLEDIYGTYTATDAEDGDLTAKVEVSGIVNFKQPGHYTMTYKVTDSDGNEVTKTREIAVVDMEDFTNLSDYDWMSASIAWGSIKKDRSPSDNIIRLTDKNGQEVQFEKGLGTHARSVIKYDLTDKEAEYFSAYVGVDRAMYGSIASVAFEVWLDGEKVTETGVIYSKDPMEYLEVNVAGAKELMLVATDGGNGNGSDHAVWGDAKLHYANENNIKVDTEGLLQLIEEINGLNQEDYTQASWRKLAQVKDEALALLSGNMTQEQVDGMITKLLVAKEELVSVGNKKALESLIKSVNDLQAHIYTQASWQVLLGEVGKAKEVLTIEEPGEAVINKAMQDLQGYIDSLEISQGKAGLYELLEVANAMEKDNYSEKADWANFEEVTTYYNELYWVPTAHSEDMYELVLEYYSGLIQTIESHRITLGNKKALEGLIESINDLQVHIYTQASWASLIEEVEETKKVLSLEEISEEIINKAIEDLQASIDGLEISKGKADFYELLQVTNTMEKNNYSEEADWATFEEMRAYYNDLYWAPSAHKEEIYVVVVDYFRELIASIEVYRIPDAVIEEIEAEVPEVEQSEVEQPEVEVPEVEQLEV